MGNSIKFSRDYILIFTIVLLSTVLIFVFSKEKINYHLDELLTYTLSNSTTYINFEPGERYEEYGELQESFLSVAEGEAFDYQKVWENQADDVHPPFYYVLIHTISSFMPGEFSKYIGIAVNMLFNALTILLLFKFSLLLSNSKKIAYATSLFWAVNPGVISDMMFIRMYIMAMFFCLLISYVHIKHMHNVTIRNYKFYLSLFLVSVAGFLTHYYFIIFTFFLCAFYVLYLLIKRKFKGLLMYIATYILTIACVLGIFPSVYTHILGDGNRGEQSFDNFLSLEGYAENVKVFWTIISDNFFGGYLLYLTIGMVVIVFATGLTPLKKYASKSFLDRSSIWTYILLIMSCTLFILLISNIAVFSVERYIQPAFPILILIFVTLLFHGVKLVSTENITMVIGCVMLVVICLTGYTKTTSFEYMIKDSEKALEVAEKFEDKNSVYLYELPWKILTHYEELAHYQSVTFYKMDDLDALAQRTNYDDFVLYINSDDESIVKSIVDRLPKVEKYTQLNNYGYSHVYYLE